MASCSAPSRASVRSASSRPMTGPGGLPAKLGKEPATPIDHLSARSAGPGGPRGVQLLRYLGAGGPGIPGSPVASHVRYDVIQGLSAPPRR